MTLTLVMTLIESLRVVTPDSSHTYLQGRVRGQRPGGEVPPRFQLRAAGVRFGDSGDNQRVKQVRKRNKGLNLQKL